jgi:hypothetical protein
MDRQELIKKAVEVAEVVHKKGKAYGPSSNTDRAMQAIFPAVGNSLNERIAYGLARHIVENLCRIGNGHHADSWRDITGLGLRGVEQFETEKPDNRITE